LNKDVNFCWNDSTDQWPTEVKNRYIIEQRISFLPPF